MNAAPASLYVRTTVAPTLRREEGPSALDTGRGLLLLTCVSGRTVRVTRLSLAPSRFEEDQDQPVGHSDDRSYNHPHDHPNSNRG